MSATPHPSPAEVNELLPCPFCGSEGAKFAFTSDGDECRVVCAHWCSDEQTCMGSGTWHDNRPDAIAAWNRRTLAQPAAAGEAVAWLTEVWMQEVGGSGGYWMEEVLPHREEGEGFRNARPLYTHPLPASAGDAVLGRVSGWLPKQRAVEVMLDESVPGWLAVQNAPVILRAIPHPDAATTGADAKEGT